MKRIWLFLALIGSCSLGWAAPKPLVFWVNGQSDEKYYLEMIRLYKETVDPTFEAKVFSYGFMEMPDKLAVAIKSGVNPPDIVQLDEIYFSLYLRGTIPFLDITSRIEKSGVGAGFLPQRMRLFTWKDRIYGLPQSVSNVVLYYRSDLFKDLDITPNSISTWTKFEETAKRIKSGSRFMIGIDWCYFEILMRQRGYELFDKNGAPTFDTKVGEETLARIVSWGKNGYGIHPTQGHIFNPEFLASDVAKNRVLCVIAADWYGLDFLQGNDPKHHGKWRAMPLPVWEDSLSRGRNTTSFFSGQGLVIFKKTRQPDRAWEFIKWVMSDPEANVQRYIQGNCFTPYRPAWSDIRFSRKNDYFGGQSLGSLFMELAPKTPTVNQSPHRAKFVNLLMEKYWTSITMGEVLPAEALQEIRLELSRSK